MSAVADILAVARDAMLERFERGEKVAWVDPLTLHTYDAEREGLDKWYVRHGTATKIEAADHVRDSIADAVGFVDPDDLDIMWHPDARTPDT